MRLELEVKFTGESADDAQLPAYSATESLEGIARSLLIVTNFLAERRVRRRDFHYQNYELSLLAFRPGSFLVPFDIHIVDHALQYLPEIGVGIATSFLTDLLKAVYRRSIGKSAPELIEQLEANEKLRAGDLGALVDAVEPAIRRAHTVINRGANNIVIITGENSIVNFDAQSKEYVQKNVYDEEPRSKLFSVASYNAISRYGRVFDFDLGKTVPFTVSNAADAQTVEVIVNSIHDYAMVREGANINSAIAIRYTQMLSLDGRVKKITVHKARGAIEELM